MAHVMPRSNLNHPSHTQQCVPQPTPPAKALPCFAPMSWRGARQSNSSINHALTPSFPSRWDPCEHNFEILTRTGKCRRTFESCSWLTEDDSSDVTAMVRYCCEYGVDIDITIDTLRTQPQVSISSSKTSQEPEPVCLPSHSIRPISSAAAAFRITVSPIMADCSNFSQVFPSATAPPPIPSQRALNDDTGENKHVAHDRPARSTPARDSQSSRAGPSLPVAAGR
ncbi:hypothetical protein BDV95DRAFT_375894 [Massariosphaeria phaeospora]|uniref:Uncharacterized protein n=1 Tax=Massariosphaeria phaeospora TaxID=100035 RepID=A0A7C8IBU7_9PLEO|nr:hypothetical protein BDV95DRAFT_375894 [Massariosphaeria phaeospora]